MLPREKYILTKITKTVIITVKGHNNTSSKTIITFQTKQNFKQNKIFSHVYIVKNYFIINIFVLIQTSCIIFTETQILTSYSRVIRHLLVTFSKKLQNIAGK